MRAKFPVEVEGRILTAAREIWQARFQHPKLIKVELGRMLFTKFHCRSRMVQVKCFEESGRPGFPTHIHDAVVCPVCLDGAIILGEMVGG